MSHRWDDKFNYRFKKSLKISQPKAFLISFRARGYNLLLLLEKPEPCFLYIKYNP